MKYFFVWMIIASSLFGAKLVESKWLKGQTFSDYLDERNISNDMLQHISKDDRQFLSDINSQYSFYELINKDGMLLQALIPISEEMQIHLSKEKNNESYDFDIIPIEYETDEYFAKVTLESNPYSDTLKTTQNTNVAKRLSMALKGTINGKKLQKGDEIDFLYRQNTRMGKPYLMPDIKVVRVVMGNKEQFVYVDEDGDGFAQVGKAVPYKVKGKKKVVYTKRVPVSKENSRFGMPLRNVRVTSNFSYRRWHPILHRYRPHHGTDFGARRGTPLLAVNDGIISYSGRMGSYGNVVKIRHAGGYESLYAHQSRIRARKGQRVKKGQIIGYVGSTGRSTGPHLHFGLMKNGRWIDPMKVLRKKSINTTMLKKFTKYEDVTTTKYKTVEIKGAKENKRKLLNLVNNHTSTHIWN